MTEYFLKMRHGPAIDVEYIDMSDPAEQEAYPELLALIAEQGLPYPLVAVNGQLRLAGSVEYYRIGPLVEEVLQPQPEASEA